MHSYTFDDKKPINAIHMYYGNNNGSLMNSNRADPKKLSDNVNYLRGLEFVSGEGEDEETIVEIGVIEGMSKSYLMP